ncbi:MAG: protein serine/threonine phosphatase 2C family protein [Phycisphaerales bacterium]|nr:protein serine/threonine phosphatase 2C family protein [Phycisphaerales bacterium]
MMLSGPDTSQTTTPRANPLPVLSLASAQGRRERQEDAGCAVSIDRTHDRPCFVLGVADGVGGLPKGDDASRAGLRAAMAELFTRVQMPDPDIEASLAAACDAAQDKVLSLAEPGGRGPASTLVLAVVTEDVVSVAWLGDSPACIVRGAEVIVLTEPHADESGAITAFLGHPGRPACSFECCVLQPGDALLIMSDGVSGVLDPENLIRLVSETEPADLARVLVDEAVLLGSQDNCTAACLVLPDPASAVIAEDGPDVFESAVPVDPPSRIRRFVLEATLREFAVESDKECVPC